MNSAQRREKIVEEINKSDKPLSASFLAKLFEVSRQVVVGDIALLRAGGHLIIATPRGYTFEKKEKEGIVRTIAVSHKSDKLAEEIYTIVDLGGVIIDVIVEHPVYGELSGTLHIASRYDADQFLNSVKEHQAKPLSELTNGLHLHTIQCENEIIYQRILQGLEDKGFLY
ncbi:MAG: transcription repressor NadR [Longicatena sp.]